MTDTPAGAPAPKKRSFFKRAAWQDAAKKDGEDIFSHSNEFNDLVAEQNRRKAEARQKAEAEQKRKQEQRERERKKRRLSVEEAAPAPTRKSSVPAAHEPDSLAARYETLTEQSVFDKSPPRKEPVVIDLGSDDEADSGHDAKSFNSNPSFNYAPDDADPTPHASVRPSPATVQQDDDDLEEVLDPEMAALEAKARARAAARQAEAAAKATASSQQNKSPVAQLFIKTEIPDTTPLMVKVRLDTTLEKPREAWCARQNFTPEMTKRVFFTWRRTRVFDSTTIKRLGMTVDVHGSVSIEGDSNIYDDENLPKVFVEAWTDEILEQVKQEEAAEAAALRKAASPSPEVEEREPTPQPEPAPSKIKLVLRAKGKEDFRISVHPHTDIAHLTQAYRNKLKVHESQPLTLIWEGDRLSPMDTVEELGIEEMDMIDVQFK